MLIALIISMTLCGLDSQNMFQLRSGHSQILGSRIWGISGTQNENLVAATHSYEKKSVTSTARTKKNVPLVTSTARTKKNVPRLVTSTARTKKNVPRLVTSTARTKKNVPPLVTSTRSYEFI